MAAMYLETRSFALTAAMSPDRGAARRCAAAFGLDSAQSAGWLLPCPHLTSRVTRATQPDLNAAASVITGLDPVIQKEVVFQ